MSGPGVIRLLIMLTLSVLIILAVSREAWDEAQVWLLVLIGVDLSEGLDRVVALLRVRYAVNQREWS